MKQITFLLLCCLFSLQVLLAQNVKTIYLQRHFTLEKNENLQEIWQNIKPFENKKNFIIQFNEIPTDAQKAEMKNLGVELLHYVPDYAWFASAPENLDIEKLKIYPIYAFSPIYGDMKLTTPLLITKLITYEDLDATKLRPVEICTFLIDNEGFAIQKLAAIGAKNIQKGTVKNTFFLEIPENKIYKLAEIPFIYFISEKTPAPQLELSYRNTVGRANYLSSGINGMNFNGAGVTLAIEEGGILDTLSIDFQGRKKERTAGNSVSDHKTGCHDNAGSAGNYDPKFRANAWGADIISLSGSSWSFYDTANLRMASHSYGWGVSGGYWSGAADHDQQVRMQPSMMHFYSSGNQGSDTCNYGIYNGIAAWANLTGGSKQAKNIMAINNTSPYDSLSFGSVGPAFDGRIKPDLCIEGWEGTSYASPKAAGMMAQLYQVWKQNHNGADPQSGLIKAFMLNTADDLYNPGPDFRTGFGRINARRAYKGVNGNQFFVDSLGNGNTKQHTLNVPANVKEVRMMLYWTDYEATVNAAKALVNDLNFSVQTPQNTTFLPWKLNLFPHADSLAKPATRGVDSLNNVEQITIPNPAAGNYTLTVNGHLVPQGPQKYWIVYEFIYDELTLTYPIGKEAFVAGESEIIRWDNYGGNSSISVDFSQDNGATWTNIVSNLPNGQTQYKWTVPAIMTGQAKIRVQSGTKQSVSLLPFNIMPVPQNLHRVWSCGDSLMLKWDALPSATAYRITRLGQKYMDSVGVTTATHFKVKNVNQTTGEWLSVQAYGPQNALSRRALAWHTPLGDTNCVPFEASLIDISPYKSGYYPDCYTDHNRLLKTTIQNNGLNTVTNATLKYRLDGGTIYTSNFAGNLASADDISFAFADSISALAVGTHNLKVWVKVTGDNNPTNDTLKATIIVYPSSTVNVNTMQDFDAFTNCSTAWGCETEICGLSAGWFNVPNTPTILGDSIDFRTLNGATATGSTGPDFDHTTGTNVGKYLYLEGSGNGGNGCQYKEARLHSTCIDLGGANNPALDFWYHAYGGSIGTLNIDVLGENGWANNQMPEIAGDHGNVWLNQVVSLNDFAGEKEVVVSFRAKTGGGFASDFAIDDVKTYSLPTADFSITTPNPICVGANVLFNNISTNANTYTWDISPNTFAFQNGTNANSINPEIYFINAGSYTVSLTATNANGNDTSLTQVNVLAVPNPFTISPNSFTVCQGDTLILTANTGNYTGTYLWQWMGDSTFTNNSTIIIPNPPISNTGLFTCAISNICGNQTTAININVIPLPIISLGNDTTIFTNQSITLDAGVGFATYQWNGNPAQNQATLLVNGAQTGVGTFPYWVQVTDPNGFGCENSDTILITVDLFISILENIENQAIVLYPNPNHGSFYLELGAKEGQEIAITLFDISGKKVATENYFAKKNNSHLLNIPNLAKGTYTLVAKWGGQERSVKVSVE